MVREVFIFSLSFVSWTRVQSDYMYIGGSVAGVPFNGLSYVASRIKWESLICAHVNCCSWVVTPCGSEQFCWRFGVACCLDLHVQGVLTFKVETECTSKVLPTLPTSTRWNYALTELTSTITHCGSQKSIRYMFVARKLIRIIYLTVLEVASCISLPDQLVDQV
jgi:hypothetical protein